MFFSLCFLLFAALTPQQSQGWRDRIQADLFIPNPLPSPKVEHYGSFEPEPGILAERIAYSTAYGQRVPAILYRPKSPRGQTPALVIVNGHGGDKYSWYAFYAGVLYARAGAAVLTYDVIGEGERNVNRQSFTRAHDRIQSPEIARRLSGLMVTDVIEKQSASEIREGGVQALGANIPALTREQLSVFTPAQWQKQKASLTYEAWLAAAKGV